MYLSLSHPSHAAPFRASPERTCVVSFLLSDVPLPLFDRSKAGPLSPSGVCIVQSEVAPPPPLPKLPSLFTGTKRRASPQPRSISPPKSSRSIPSQPISHQSRKQAKGPSRDHCACTRCHAPEQDRQEIGSEHVDLGLVYCHASSQWEDELLCSGLGWQNVVIPRERRWQEHPWKRAHVESITAAHMIPHGP